MTENERVKEVRKKLELTQEKFGESLGLKRNSVSTIESGINAVSDQVRRAIVREYGIREEWLRDGTGEMFAPKDRDQELAEMFGRVALKPGYKRDLFAAMARLSDEDLEKLAELAVKLAKNMNQADE